MARFVASQTDRLLLHLLEMEPYRDEPEVPLGASQEGIAQRLGTQVHNASRALSSLEADGLVMDRLAHVRGAPKRRRAYFLTDRGHKAANHVREGLMDTRVRFEDRGKTEVITVGEAVKRIQASTGSTLGLFDLAEYVRGTDVVRSAELVRTLTPAGGRETYVEAAVGRPRVGAFFGREEERKALSGHIEGDGSAALIWGMPGIGKTSLASRLFDQLSGHRHLFWYAIHSWDTEEHFSAALARFLESAGRPSTAAEIRRGSKSGDLFRPLLSDMTGLNVVLFLDDVHKASGRLSLTLSVVLEAAKASRSCKVVLMSRELPPFFSKTAEGNATIELSGLDSTSALEFARSTNAKDPAGAAGASRGHPLLLSLMAKSGLVGSKGDIVSFMDREVSMSLLPKERAVLERLSIFRHPVPAEAVADAAGETLLTLKDKALVVEDEQGLWTHDVLREFFVSRLGQDTREALHVAAAAYCERREGPDWKLESLHHYVQAGDWASARRVSLSAASELLAEFPQETLALLSQVPAEGGTGDESTGVLFLMGQLHEAMRDDLSAARYYENCLKSMPGDETSVEEALVLEALGKLKTRVEQWSESFSAHETALRIYQEEEDPAGQIREWLNIGGAHRVRSDYAKAREAYSEALSLASTEEDRSAQAACLNNLALLEWDEGKYPEAEKRFKESIRLAHAMRNHAGEARGLENLAGLLRAQGKLSDASSLLRDSSEAFRRAEELEEAKRVLAVCAETLGTRGQLDNGIELCRDALVRPELRRPRGLFQRAPRYDSGDALLSLVLISLLRSSGDLVGAEREAKRLSEIAESLDDEEIRSKVKVELALTREGAGDLERAESLLSEAEGLLAAAGSKGGLIAVNMMLGNLDEKRGRYDDARSHYEEAARHAEVIGDSSALASARRNIAAINDGRG